MSNKRNINNTLNNNDDNIDIEEYKQYCNDMLPLVSRTFALGIGLLKDPLSTYVGVSYLICRITDSVEDTNKIESKIRSNLLRKIENGLCDINKRDEILKEIKDIFPLEKFKGDEYELLHNTYKVMKVYDTFPNEVKNFIKECVKEMASGMADTVDREKDGFLEGLKDYKDLEQYCYYVAGTVGKLLTKLFVYDRNLSKEIEKKLNSNEIKFGLGLQLTNILKGIFDDYKRGVIYLPHTLLKEHDLTFKELFDNPTQDKCKKLIYSFVEFIKPYLDNAVEYTLAIPIKERDIRLFCTLPILFALRTLKLAKENPDILLSGKPLKIKRKEVKELHIQAEKKVDENEKLYKLFQKEKNF